MATLRDILGRSDEFQRNITKVGTTHGHVGQVSQVATSAVPLIGRLNLDKK